MKKTAFQDTSELENIRAAEFFHEDQLAVFGRTDRIFAFLLPIQWLAGIAAAFLFSPLTWNGEQSSVPPHLWFAIIAGTAITSLPLYLTIVRPGETVTRQVVAVSQMLMSGLLIHVTGGRIETHFYVFGSLAFLSCYRDWRVLISATIVTVLDHIVRGWLYPSSIYGILTGAEWRWLEHAGWVIFTDIFLTVSCVWSVKEMRRIAKQTASYTSSEERYRAVVEQTTEGIVLVQPETLQVIDCNEAFSRLIGCKSLAEAKTLKAYDFTAAGREELEQLSIMALERAVDVKGNRTFRRRDGSPIPVEIGGSVITYNGNRAFCISVKDITRRTAANAKIKRLALVAQKTQNLVIVCSPDGYIEWVNEGFTRVTGYESGEVIGKSPMILAGPLTSVETISVLRKAVEERIPFEGEIYNYRKDGSGYWISMSSMPIINENGKLEGFISIETDITERKAMEKELQQANAEMELRVEERTGELNETREFLHAVIDNVSSLIFVKDVNGKYVLGNQALADQRGTTVAELVGKTLCDFGGDTDEARAFTNEDIELLEHLADKLIPEEKHIDAEGNVRWYQTAKRSVVIGKNNARFLVGVSTDFTERKFIEYQLRHAQKMESIGQLAAGIAHEINTPTQYVGDNIRFVRDAFTDVGRILRKYDSLLDAAGSGEIDLALVSGLKAQIDSADLDYMLEEVPKALKQSLDGITRIAKIVQSMKDFAHPDSREKQYADINRAIESTITVARNEWKYVADLETRFDENLPPVSCFLGEFNQVVLNIVVNAAHAITDVVGDGSMGKGKITITTTKVDRDWAEVRIADTGNGIPHEIKGRIFDPFFTTKEVGKGTGQGLAISHTVVVEKHSGQLSFETEPGHGTTFIIRLPLSST